MAIKYNEINLNRILIVDDNPGSREGFGLIIEDIPLSPIQEIGPISDIGDFLNDFKSKADAVLCDYKLQVRTYSRYNGDAIVAALFKRKIPGILCTSFTDVVDIMDRHNLRYIPSLLKTSKPDIDTIIEAYHYCLDEMNGKIKSSRKPWRSLVRVEEHSPDNPAIYITVPGWDRNRKIKLQIESFPPYLRNIIIPGKRLHAVINIGAESHDELFFDEWEPE